MRGAAPRYSYRFADNRFIPTVEVTDQRSYVENDWGFFVDAPPVKTMRGFTTTHAMNRALRWGRKHGDTR